MFHSLISTFPLSECQSSDFFFLSYTEEINPMTQKALAKATVTVTIYF